MRRFNPCENMNHRRLGAPVRCCPQCGDVVNAAIAARRCDEPAHAAARRRLAPFCVDCGIRLVAER